MIISDVSGFNSDMFPKQLQSHGLGSRSSALTKGVAHLLRNDNHWPKRFIADDATGIKTTMPPAGGKSSQ